jgi:hypothetical protein
MEMRPLGPSAKELSGMGEGFHRALLAVLFLATISCAFLTYCAIDTYLDSGRSLFGDTRTTTGYLWKKGSCDDLFRGYLSEPLPSVLHDRSHEICALARDRGIPPVALKPLIGKAPYATERRVAEAGASDVMQSLVREVKASLLRQLPDLEARHRDYRRTVSFMWLFFPAVLGAIASYVYARSHTPALFAIIKARFEHIMFGRNRYSDAFDNLIKLNKKTTARKEKI